MKKETFNLKLVLVFLVLSLVLASPFIYRAFMIHEIYIYPDVRQHVLDSVFFLREEYGLTIGDLTINDVELDGEKIHITIHEKYRGFLDKNAYEDLNQDYFIDYSYKTDDFNLVNIEK